MSLVAVQIGPSPTALPVPDRPAETFDPGTFAPEFVADLDALAESTKCSCAASDDQPY